MFDRPNGVPAKTKMHTYIPGMRLFNPRGEINENSLIVDVITLKFFKKLFSRNYV